MKKLRSRVSLSNVNDLRSRLAPESSKFDGSTEARLVGLAESPDVSPEVWEKLKSAIKRRQEPNDE
jgi:hypothetical protein